MKKIKLLSISFELCCITVFAQINSLKYPNDTDQKILFVCEHGAGRSILAATLFNLKVQQLNLPYYAVAVGITPQDSISRIVEVGFHVDNIPAPFHQPRGLTRMDIETAAKVILLDCVLPDSITVKVNTTLLTVPLEKGYIPAKEELCKYLSALFEQLKN